MKVFISYVFVVFFLQKNISSISNEKQEMEVYSLTKDL